MAEAKRDQNQVVTLMGVTDDGNLTPVNLVVDPTTGRLKVSAVIAAGTITSVNGLSAATQLFAVGTAGDDFNIASVTATHTFNLPTASATKRGALSSADWTTFNSKAPALGADDNYVTDAEKTKIGYISVTQAVDLDAIETRVNALDAAVILIGSWDASAGTFPGSGTAQAGYTYIVSVAGTVDSIAFSIGDRILAIIDNASTGTYASNWLKLDYTDQVLSVAGKTGAVTLQVADVTDMTANARSFNQAANYAAMRTALGVGTGDSPQFTGIEVGHASDSTITRVSAGVLAIEGNNIITTATLPTVPVKATGAELNTGTDDAKFATAKAIADSFLGVQGGWSPLGACTYEGADAPSFTFSIASDMTGIISVGMRIKLTQTTVKYFIVTAVGAYSGGKTIFTVYGGTDYTLANAAITLPFYSMMKAPFGFPLDPLKWSVETTDTSLRTQASPSASTWYNPGGANNQLSIPIGCWDVSYKATGEGDTIVSQNIKVTLSTANNSESDSDFTVANEEIISSGTQRNSCPAFAKKYLILAAKTLYYLNITTSATGVGNLWIRGDNSKTVIRATCAYL